jgi:hypothetical protein
MYAGLVGVLLAYRAGVWALKRRPGAAVKGRIPAISPGALRDNP